MSRLFEDQHIVALHRKLHLLQRNGKNTHSTWADLAAEYRRIGRHDLADHIAELLRRAGR